MTKFKYKIQSYIIIELEAKTKEEGRKMLMESDNKFYEELLENVTISKGEKKQ